MQQPVQPDAKMLTENEPRRTKSSAGAVLLLISTLIYAVVVIFGSKIKMTGMLVAGLLAAFALCVLLMMRKRNAITVALLGLIMIFLFIQGVQEAQVDGSTGYQMYLIGRAMLDLACAIVLLVIFVFALIVLIFDRRRSMPQGVKTALKVCCVIISVLAMLFQGVCGIGILVWNLAFISVYVTAHAIFQVISYLVIAFWLIDPFIPTPVMRPYAFAGALPVAQLPDETEQLKKYKELLDKGVITEEEFEAKKKQIMGI